jgi:hypothetical protein
MRDNKKVVWVEFSTLWNHALDGHWSLIALALIAIDIATNRWRGLRAETKTAALLIETAIFLDRAYCNLLRSFDQLLGSGCDI